MDLGWAAIPPLLVAAKSVRLNGPITTNASLGVQTLAVNGMGLAVLPQLIAEPYLKPVRYSV